MAQEKGPHPEIDRESVAELLLEVDDLALGLLGRVGGFFGARFGARFGTRYGVRFGARLGGRSEACFGTRFGTRCGHGRRLADVVFDVRRGIVAQQVFHEGDLGGVLRPAGLPHPRLDLLAHVVADLEDLQGVDVPQRVEADDRERQPDIDRVTGAVVLPGHQRDPAQRHPDTVEDEVQPGPEDGALAGQPGHLPVHAVEDETQVVDEGAGDQPPPVTEGEAGRRDQAEHERPPGDLVRRDPRTHRGEPHQRRGHRVDEQHGPPRVTLLLGDASHLGEGRYVSAHRSTSQRS